ncbi:hypothetical protein AXY1_78 [Achromobacter phage AXY1]|nr:hypothetical protein AXY1_78 [Achromobacter phage AXY1]
MFEQFLAVLTRIAAALEAIAGNGGGLATSTAADKPADKPAGKAGKGTTTKAATAPSADECNAALVELKDYIDSKGEKGITFARKVMKEVAGVEKMAEIPEDKRAGVIKAAAKELEAYKAAEDAGGEEM